MNVRSFALVATICALIYAWFVDEAIVSETIAAVAVGLTVAVASAGVGRAAVDRARVRSDCLAPFVKRVLPAMFLESFELIGPVLWRAIVRRERATGRWIAVPYDPRDVTPADEHGRRAIVIFGQNLTPNALPLDVDVLRRRIVLHQLVARRESAASDHRYPM